MTVEFEILGEENIEKEDCFCIRKNRICKEGVDSGTDNCH